ncbi:hypothetical protein [Phenylobacterium sp.]|uniref:hypothetical protein n=1 Tax=Phenylobacterium sp. TaxID=1871053 RepID=UPI00286C40D9|nr:hypothetical protein [Phenylobacterium sp.]
MSIILARLRRLRLLVQAALTSPKVRRDRRAVRVFRQTKPSAADAWRSAGSPTPQPSLWRRTPALQPAKVRKR